jgi:hypothetical protein
MVIETSGVLANLRLEIEDLLCHCSVWIQNSDVDRQNSVTSKPFSGQNHMGNG